MGSLLRLLRSKRNAWTPAKLASLGAYWWRADMGVTLRATSYVDTWEDQLQGAVLEIADAYQPTLVADVWNGNLPTVRFANASATALEWTSPPTLSGAVTHLMIVDFAGPFTGNKYVLDSTTSGTNIGHGFGWVGPVSGSGVSAFRRSSFAVTNWATSVQIDQQRALVLVMGGTGTPDNKAYLAGGSDLLTSTYTDTLGSTAIRLGAFNSGTPSTTFSADMDLLEWVVVPSELDAATINEWLGYAERIAGLSYTEVS